MHVYTHRYVDPTILLYPYMHTYTHTYIHTVHTVHTYIEAA